MVFVCHPKILHKHCLRFLLGVKMAPREIENNACLFLKIGVSLLLQFSCFQWTVYFLARSGFETLRGEKNILLVWFLHNLNCINFNLRVIGVSFKDISNLYIELIERILDCSQSPIFSWDSLDIPRLTATAILIFKCTEGAGVGDYSSGWGDEKPPPPPK